MDLPPPAFPPSSEELRKKIQGVYSSGYGDGVFQIIVLGSSDNCTSLSVMTVL